MRYLEGLKQVIQAQGLTYQELAELSGIPHSHISNLANRKHQANPNTAAKLSVALSCSVPDLITAPNIRDLLTDLLATLHKYERFCEESQREYGIIWDKIDE